jgi:hypothetical protein
MVHTVPRYESYPGRARDAENITNPTAPDVLGSEGIISGQERPHMLAVKGASVGL